MIHNLTHSYGLVDDSIIHEMNNEHILSYETVPKITFIGEMVDILFCRAILCMQYVLGVHD